MALSVEIDSVAVDINKESFNITMAAEARSTAFFEVVDTTGAVSYVRGTPVEIFDSDLNTIFAGFIDTPGRARKLGVGTVHYYDISCMDNHYLADKRLIVKSYSSQTLEYIVEDILTDYLAAEGVTEGEIQTGPVIDSAIFNYVKASAAFDALKELTGFTWYIDEDKKLYFVDRSTNAAAWNLDGVTYRAVKGSVHLSTGNPLFRTRQYVRGGKGQTASQVETFTGDAVTVAFTVGYPLSTVPTVTVDGGGKTVGIKGLDSGKDCYWNKGDATITFDTAPGNTLAVVITYVGEYPLIALAENHAAVLSQKAIEGGTGYIEEIITEAQHETGDAMRESAKAKVDLYSQDAERFTYQTRDAGLYPGTLQEITYSPFSFSAHEMLIESIMVTAIGDDVIYTVVAVTGPSAGDWTSFFANIIKRQELQVKIGDSLLIYLVIESDNLALAESTGYHTDAFPPDVSRFIATAPTQGETHHVRHEAFSLAETPTLTEHLTEDYEYDDAASKYGFATYA